MYFKKIIIIIMVFFLSLALYGQKNYSVRIKNLPGYQYSYRGNTLTHIRYLPDYSAVQMYFEDDLGSQMLSDNNIITNAMFQTQSFNTQIVGSIKSVKFYAIYRMINAYADIEDYNSFNDDKRIEMLATYDTATNTINIEFPVINKTTDPALCLAMHSYYVLSKYRTLNPINTLTDNTRMNINIDTISRNIDPHYSVQDKDITMPIYQDHSYADCTVKHEYGHHIYHSGNKGSWQ